MRESSIVRVRKVRDSSIVRLRKVITFLRERFICV